MTIEERVAAIENRLASSDIFHPKFLARAFAVYGHYIVANVIIVGVIFAAVFLLGLLTGLST